MKFSNFIKRIAIILLAFITFYTCNNDDEAFKGTSQITVKLMDEPGDYDHVYIDVVDVMVKVNDNSDDDNGWISLEAINTGVYDLLELTGGINVLLVDDFEIPSGTLNQIRLVLGVENSIVIDGVTHPLNTPSAQQSGLKIKVNQTLEQNIGYTFLLDFNVDESIVEAGNSGNINLKPVIRASLEAYSGAITGQISPSVYQTEVVVHNGSDTPVSAYTDSNGNFVLVGLSEGFYTVTITPDPISELDHIVLENIEVAIGQITELGTIEIE